MPFITESDGKPRYLFTGNYCDEINGDINAINKLLSEQEEIVNRIPKPYIPQINFIKDPSCKGPLNYSFLQINSPTATGRVPKYTQVVHFRVKINNYFEEWRNASFGEIYYLQNGQIGKVRVILWRNSNLYVIHIKRENNKLVVSKTEYK